MVICPCCGHREIANALGNLDYKESMITSVQKGKTGTCGAVELASCIFSAQW